MWWLTSPSVPFGRKLRNIWIGSWRSIASFSDEQLPPQPAFQVLALSAAVRVHHLIRIIPPSIIRNMATTFDRKIVELLQGIMGGLDWTDTEGAGGSWVTPG